jgi:hypothetical protein
MERVGGLLGGLERAVLPQDLDVVGISGTRREDLHQQDLIEWRAHDREVWPVDQDLAVVLLERRRKVRTRTIVQPRGREPVTGGHAGDSDPELLVDGSRAVDVPRCLAEPVERKEGSAHDHDATSCAVAQFVGDLEQEAPDVVAAEWLVRHRPSSDLARGSPHRS